MKKPFFRSKEPEVETSAPEPPPVFEAPPVAPVEPAPSVDPFAPTDEDLAPLYEEAASRAKRIADYISHRLQPKDEETRAHYEAELLDVFWGPKT
jgi:hypothetical protein